MLITNRHSYPQSIVEACKAQLYHPIMDTLRVTELIDSPLIKRLSIEHWGGLEIDVDEIIYSSLFGVAFHEFVAKYEADAMVERRWYAKLPDTDMILSGQTDIFKPQEGVIEDNKTQSAWAFVFSTPNWERQLNVYAYLVEANGYDVRELWINSFLRDWSKYLVKQSNNDYPTHKFHRIKCNLWDANKRHNYILERLAIHNDPNYVCSDEERWRRPTTWAVKKKGTKTARRVLDTKDKAEQWITENKPKGDIYVEKRDGGCIRCLDYCTARSICPYKDKE